MTISLAWVRRNKATVELIVASDSRLRSRGPLDQAQKIFPLERGDCCLAFCGDTQITYPLFMQVGSTINNFIKTKTRAEDVTKVAHLISQLLDQLVSSWDLPTADKYAELCHTKIIFGGWSWQNKRFDIGVFEYGSSGFKYVHPKMKLPHPWGETHRSLMFIGDYEAEYMASLVQILERRKAAVLEDERTGKRLVDFDFEPLEALNLLLQEARSGRFPAVGGAPQVAKVYSYGNSLPIVIRLSKQQHFLFGRKLFEWEKTEYPVLDLTESPLLMRYPKEQIPLPGELNSPSKDLLSTS